MYASATAQKPLLVWQGSTKDGYTLRLTHSGLARITSKLKQTGLENLVKSNMNGNLEGAVVRLIAQMVSNATRSGTLSRPDSGTNIQVFTTIGRTRNYQILIQPLGSRQGAIIFIRSRSREISREWEQESEYERESKQSLQEADYEGGGSRKRKSPSSTTSRSSGIAKRRRTSSGSKSRRNIALGKTPGKTSPAGRAVLKRWDSKGKAKWTGPKGKEDYGQTQKWKVSVDKGTGKGREWVNLNKNIHMGHKLAAADYWQKGGSGYKSKHGVVKRKYKQRYQPYQKPGYKAATKFRSPIHRQFMRDPANYRFEWGPANSRDGARMTARYTSLPSGEKKWLK